MPAHRHVRLEPLLSPAEADAMVRLCERFGRYKMYSEEAAAVEIGEGLTQRHDAVLNFLRTGGRHGRRAEVGELAARTNYFRESYAYGEHVMEGVESFRSHPAFVAAAQAIHGRPLIEPAIVYANLLLPGQELAVHTDVPEFRGANRLAYPQWLMVVMHHSGLFDDWRLPIATGVSWFNESAGGEFVFYPDGADGAPVALPARWNSAIVLDTDSVFHGVDPVASDAPLPPLRPGMQLEFAGARRWRVVADGVALATYRWDELRFSVSWKAYCFRDEPERRAWRSHSDDLELPFILDRLVADLRARGRMHDVPSDQTALALTLIDEYVRFPAPERR
jgi:hypothetical protein